VPHNPLANPLLEPTVLRILLLLGLAALIIFTVERRNLSRWKESVLFQRVASWAVMAPIFTISVFTGGVVALGLVALMSFQGLREFARLVRVQKTYVVVLIAYCWFGLLITGLWGTRFFLFLPLGFFAAATIIPLVRLSRKATDVGAELFQASAVALGYLWIGLSLSFFVLIGRVEQRPVAILLLIGFAVALSDVLAFTIGKVGGGPRLSPAVSPNKTWAGVAGNVAGAYLSFLLMGFAVPPEWSQVTRWVLPLVIGVGAVWGDLVESLVKRGFGKKDAGDVLPGFGGLLDRIDSLLLAMPLGYYAVKVLEFYTS
jgi:phosphatidate cytidylyltransferase